MSQPKQTDMARRMNRQGGFASPVTIMGILLAIFLVLSVPIFLSLLLPTIIAYNLSDLGLPQTGLVQHIVQGANSTPLLAIPLFVFAADIISRGEIGQRLVDVADALVGHIPGGLAVSTVITMAIFGAISGIGIAAVVSIGPVIYPALIKEGYSRSFSIGLILTGSTLAMLVPPSVAVILYCLQSDQSISQVFLSALASGLIFMVLIAIYSTVYAVRRGIASDRSFSFSAVYHSLTRAVWALLLPVIIVGGIYTGFFTPTEAAAVSAVYAIFVESFIYRRVGFRNILNISSESTKVIAMIVILIGAGATFSWFLTVYNVPQAIAGLIGTDSSLHVLIIISIIFFIAGMLVDPNSAVIVLTPLVLPAAMAVGIDPIHLGAVIVLDLAIGMITPPFGLNLFVGVVTFNSTFSECVKGVLPFIGIAIVALAITVVFPDAVMWLPNLSNAR